MKIKSIKVETFRHMNSRCIAVEFEDGTGFSIVRKDRGEYSSNQTIPENWHGNKQNIIQHGIEKLKYRIEEHNKIFGYHLLRGRDETGVFPVIVTI